jgi:histidinol-phosphate/aromatic aminotransferase/cobyric acid decarboxylase-like protein
VRDAIENRERLADALRGLGLAPIDSAANFVLVPMPNADAVGREMRARGVAVRPFRDLPLVGDALRISVGPWEMMEECVAVLGDVLASTRAVADTDTRP